MENLSQLNTNPEVLKKAIDAGFFKMFGGVFSAVRKNPIGDSQQSLLNEVKNLENSLKNTVLDKSIEKNEIKLDNDIRQFLLKVIKKEIEIETQKSKNANVFDRKPDNIARKSQEVRESQESAIKNSEIKALISENKIKQSPAETSNERVLSEDEISDAISTSIDKNKKENEDEKETLKNQYNKVSSISQAFIKSIDEAGKRLDQEKTDFGKNKKSAADLDTKNELKNEEIKDSDIIAGSRYQAANEVSEKQDIGHRAYSSVKQVKDTYREEDAVHEVSKSLVDLKKIVVEKSQISKILQRQDNVYGNRSSDTDAIENKEIVAKKKVFTLSGKKTTELNPDYKKLADAQLKLMLDKQISSAGYIKTPVNRETDLKNLVEQTDAALANEKKEISTFAKLKETLSGKLVESDDANKSQKEIAVGQNKFVRSQVEQRENKITQDQNFFQRNYDNNNRSLDNTTAALNKKLDETLQNTSVETTTVQNNQFLNDSGHTALNQNGQNQNSQTQSEIIQSAQAQSVQAQGAERKPTVIASQNENYSVPEELQTAVHWLAQEEMENTIVELLNRQAKLRGVDLS